MDDKVTLYIKKILIIGLCIGILMMYAIAAKADTLNIPSVNGMPTYGGHLVGPMGANLDSNGISGGITCLDINTTTYVPSTFNVYVGTLSPVDLSKAKFGSDSDALFKYQEAAWLIGQMENNPTQTGAISFAIWRIFSESASSGSSGDLAAENSWMNQAKNINPQLYDFSSVKIYTATDTVNQEFMSGKASPVPIPPTAWLLGSAFLGIYGIRRRIRK